MSVSDTTDLANDNLVDIAKELGLVKGAEQQLKEEEQQLKGVEHPFNEHERELERSLSDVSDYELAQQLQESEEEAQLLSDRELAEQLQMKENTFRTPMYVINIS